MNIQQILTKNSNQDRYREALEGANTFYIIADGKIIVNSFLWYMSYRNQIEKVLNKM